MAVSAPFAAIAGAAVWRLSLVHLLWAFGLMEASCMTLITLSHRRAPVWPLL
jgi:hypothetical protein